MASCCAPVAATVVYRSFTGISVESWILSVPSQNKEKGLLHRIGNKRNAIRLEEYTTKRTTRWKGPTIHPSIRLTSMNESIGGKGNQLEQNTQLNKYFFFFQIIIRLIASLAEKKMLPTALDGWSASLFAGEKKKRQRTTERLWTGDPSC